MQNLRPDELAGHARYLSGRHKPLYMMQGLDEILRRGLLRLLPRLDVLGRRRCRTPTTRGRSPRCGLNGTVVGESGINALVALGYGVPVVLVTGDDVTAAEAEAVCPGIRTAVVKTAVSRFAADSLHPERGPRADPRAARREAIAGLGAGATPPAIDAAGHARRAVPQRRPRRDGDLGRGVVRTGTVTVAITDDDPLRLFRRFVTVVLLTRDIAE